MHQEITEIKRWQTNENERRREGGELQNQIYKYKNKSECIPIWTTINLLLSMSLLYENYINYQWYSDAKMTWLRLLELLNQDYSDFDGFKVWCFSYCKKSNFWKINMVIICFNNSVANLLFQNTRQVFFIFQTVFIYTCSWGALNYYMQQIFNTSLNCYWNNNYNF